MKITFSSMLSTFVVHAPEGTLASLNATPTEIGDGVYAVGDSGMVLVDEEYQTDTIYLSTEGEDYTVEAGERICYPAEDIIVWGGNAPDRNPFKVSGKGGGGSGGDNTHYKGTTTTAISNGSTTNPITIDGESYTAVFGDIVVYGYTEFVFDGTKWSEFGRPFDTMPTQGSANAVTSDGIYQRTPFTRGSGGGAFMGANANATHSSAMAIGTYARSSGACSAAIGILTLANQNSMIATGTCNSPRNGDLFNIGNGTNDSHRSNIVEVNATSMNVNGDIQQNGVPLRATTMPTITASMLGKVVQYVGASDNNYKQGWNYVAVSDGAAEPTYSWQALMDSAPTSGSNNPVTSNGVYQRTPLTRYVNSMYGGVNTSVGNNQCFAYGVGCIAAASRTVAFGDNTRANRDNMVAIGKFNSPNSDDVFNIGNGIDNNNRSNILEANSNSVNINGDIQKNGVSLPTPYTTMPTITSTMLGQIAQYVGETTNDYVKGYFYIASSDGAAEPTYSWVSMVDATPTSGSKNFVTSAGVYAVTPWARGTYENTAHIGRYSTATNFNTVAMGYYASSSGDGAIAAGYFAKSDQPQMFSCGRYNYPKSGHLFNIGNGTSVNTRSNIVEVNPTSMNVNGDIKRDGVGIDDYTTTERKIGKWIDGSDLYQRTFEVTGLTESNQWVFNNNILGTSNIDIKDFKGYTEWSDGTNTTRFDLNFYLSNGIHSLCLNSTSDLAISLNHESTNFVKAVITIKYTKPSVQANTLNANTQQTEEPTDEMR